MAKVRSGLMWAFALIAAILVGGWIMQAANHLAAWSGGLAAARWIGSWMSHLTETFVLTFVVRPRRGWLVGVLFVAAFLLFCQVVLILMALSLYSSPHYHGLSRYGSFQLALNQWWGLQRPVYLLSFFAAIVAGALGGHFGVLLRNRLAGRRHRVAEGRN